jgi:hypothetical protein
VSILPTAVAASITTLTAVTIRVSLLAPSATRTSRAVLKSLPASSLAASFAIL